MTYKKIGRVNQLHIQSSNDLFDILALHPSLWVATSAPKNAFSMPLQFLEYLSPLTKRITYSDVVSTIKWLTSVQVSLSSIDSNDPFISINNLDTTHADFEKIHKTIHHISTTQSLDPKQITLSTVQDIKKQLESFPISETGVILPTATDDTKLKNYINLAISVTSGELHPNNEFGLGAKTLDAFSTQLDQYILWQSQYLNALSCENYTFLPLLAKTSTAYEQWQFFKPKLQTFFTQCHFLSYSKNIFDTVNTFNELKQDSLNFKDSSQLDEFLNSAPIATLNVKGVIDLKKDTLNPVWKKQFLSFMALCGEILGHPIAVFDEAVYEKIISALSPYHQWYLENPCQKLSSIAYDQLVSYQTTDCFSKALQLIEHSKKTADELSGIRLIEKLILFNQNIMLFVNNFVSFPMLYSENDKAVFEKGTLIIDGKQFKFSVEVPNLTAHLAITKTSSVFLLYVQIEPSSGEKYIITVPVTAGFVDNLAIGKRGIFLDIAGAVHDAVIINMVVNPISLKEAFTYPFKLILNTVFKKAEDINKQSNTALTTSTTELLDKKKPVPAKSGYSPITLIMGGGVAIAAIGSSFTYVVSKLLSLSWVHLISIVLLLLLFILLPPFLITFFKLKKRDISTILEGSGWAINAKMRLNRKLCALFTQKPTFKTLKKYTLD